MTTTFTNLLSCKYLENTQTTQYTSAASKTIIDKCTVTNNSANNVVLSINIVNSGDTASATNRVLNQKLMEPKETYLCPELIGHTLESGDFICTLASASSSLTINISGRVIT